MMCPFCLDVVMNFHPHLGKGWNKCPNCGATEQEHPTKPSRDKLVDTETNPADGLPKYRPSDSVARKAKKERESK